MAGLSGYGAGSLAGIHALVESAVAAVVFLAVLRALRRFPPEIGELMRGARDR